MSTNKDTPLAFAARDLLRERTEAFFACLEEAPLTFDVEAIHDLRVASRRLRAGLQLFAPCYPSADIRRLRKDVRRLTRELGELRNLDEALLFFERTAGELEGPGRELAEIIAEDFRRRQAEERERVEPILRDLQGGSLRRRMLDTASHPFLLQPPEGSIDPLTPLAGFARDALDEALTPVSELVSTARDEAQSQAQHNLRVAVKKFRYRVELLAPALGEAAGEIRSALKQYQEVLGKMHDLDVFAEEASGAAADPGLPALLERIGTLRRERFQQFEHLLATHPFEGIGSRIREAL